LRRARSCSQEHLLGLLLRRLPQELRRSLLFVLGATGGTGRALVEQARQRGHLVTAFVRSPEKLDLSATG